MPRNGLTARWTAIPAHRLCSLSAHTAEEGGGERHPDWLLPAPSRQEWRSSSFRQRNLLLKTIVRYIVENQDTICRCV